MSTHGRMLAILVALFISSPLYSQAIFAADDLIAGAKKEGGLVLYLSTNLTDANGLIQLFKQKYPFINVDFFRADNEKLLNRILTESTTGKFNGDVIMISSFEGCCCRKNFCKNIVRRTASSIPRVSPTRTASGRACTRSHE